MKTVCNCPNCQSSFDIHAAIPSFFGLIKGKKVSLVFALCQDCYNEFNEADEVNKTRIIKTSYLNVLNNQNDEWAVISSLSLDAHWGDFFSAWYYGVDLPRPVFDAINDGLVNDVAFFPSYLGGAE